MITNSGIDKQFIQEIKDLPLDMQKQLKDFIHAMWMAKKRGLAGKNLQKYIGAMDKGEAKEMAQAIAEECECLDADGW